MQLPVKIILFLSFLAIGSSFSINITACEQNVNVSNSEYDLTANLNLAASGTCIDIIASNVTVRCNGYYIDTTNSSLSGIGIDVGPSSLVSNVTIIGCKMNGSLTSGILIRNAEHLRIESTQTENTTGHAIDISSSAFNVTLFNVTSRNASYDGIHIEGKNITIQNSTVGSRGGYGIGINNAQNITITNSTISSSLVHGVYVSNVSGILNITNSQFYNTTNYLLYIINSVANINVSDSVFYSAGGAGIRIESTGIVNISSSESYNNGGAGLSIINSNISATNLTVRNNTLHGVYSSGSNITLLNLHAYNNSQRGVYAEHGPLAISGEMYNNTKGGMYISNSSVFIENASVNGYSGSINIYATNITGTLNNVTSLNTDQQGIRIDNASSLTISNSTSSSVLEGFTILDSRGITIRESRAANNTGKGIYLLNVNASVLSNINISNITTWGLLIGSGRELNVTGINIWNITVGPAIEIGNLTGINITSSSFYNNADVGMKIATTNHSVFSNITLNTTRYNLRILDSKNITVSNSTFANTSGNWSIWLENTNESNISSSTLTSIAAGTTLLISSSYNNQFDNLTIANSTSTTTSDITFSGGSGNILRTITLDNVTFYSLYGSEIQVLGFISGVAANPPNTNNISKYFQATNLSQTSSWLEANISYTDSDIANTIEYTLFVGKYNGTNWTNESFYSSQTRTEGENRISINITNFSLFGVFGTIGDNCMTLNSSYTLRNNLKGNTSDGRCITFGVSNAVLDCNNTILIGSGIGAGVYANNKTNISIINCTIITYARGISLLNVSDALVNTSTLLSNKYGVFLNRTTNVLIENSTSSNNDQDFISINNSSNVTARTILLGADGYRISFQMFDASIGPAGNYTTVPSDQRALMIVNISNYSNESWLFLNYTYTDAPRVFQEDYVDVWRDIGVGWTTLGFITNKTLDTGANVISGNISNFSIFGIFGKMAEELIGGGGEPKKKILEVIEPIEVVEVEEEIIQKPMCYETVFGVSKPTGEVCNIDLRRCASADGTTLYSILTNLGNEIFPDNQCTFEEFVLFDEIPSSFDAVDAITFNKDPDSIEGNTVGWEFSEWYTGDSLSFIYLSENAHYPSIVVEFGLPEFVFKEIEEAYYSIISAPSEALINTTVEVRVSYTTGEPASYVQLEVITPLNKKLLYTTNNNGMVTYIPDIEGGYTYNTPGIMIYSVDTTYVYSPTTSPKSKLLTIPIKISSSSYVTLQVFAEGEPMPANVKLSNPLAQSETFKTDENGSRVVFLDSPGKYLFVVGVTEDINTLSATFTLDRTVSEKPLLELVEFWVALFGIIILFGFVFYYKSRMLPYFAMPRPVQFKIFSDRKVMEAVKIRVFGAEDNVPASNNRATVLSEYGTIYRLKTDERGFFKFVPLEKGLHFIKVENCAIRGKDEFIVE